MVEELAECVTYLSLFSIIIPVLVGFYKKKYASLNQIQKLIFLLVIISFLGEAIGGILAKAKINNLAIFHLFTVLQFLALVLIMRKGLTPFLSKKVFRYISLGFVLFALLDAFWLNGINNFNNYSRPISSILVLCFALLFFYKTLKELQIRNLESVPLFWLSIGILIYHSGSLFIFLFTNYVKSSTAALYTIWGIHAIFNIILNISYSIALWVKPPN